MGESGRVDAVVKARHRVHTSHTPAKLLWIEVFVHEAQSWVTNDALVAASVAEYELERGAASQGQAWPERRVRVESEQHFRARACST